MQVITGIARGSKIHTLAGSETRPTSSRTKAGIFSAIQFELSGKKILDLFAGCGQMGIEALSRGAGHCTFVDKNKSAIKIIKENLSETLKFTKEFEDSSDLYCGDAVRFLGTTSTKFDIIFLDPPYGTKLDEILPSVAEKMADGGIIVCENEKDSENDYDGLELKKKYRYGRANVSVYLKKIK